MFYNFIHAEVRHTSWRVRRHFIRPADQPCLSPAGKAAARDEGRHLRRQHGLLFNAAVSELYRTHQTATYLGFLGIEVYPALNELQTNLPKEEVRKRLENERSHLRREARARATAFFEKPPPHKFFVTHGGPMVGMADVLGLKFETIVPECLEVWAMDF